MTSLEAVGRLGGVPDGLSAFDARRDLADVVELLELGFGDDLDPRDRQWLSELASLTELAGPLITWAVRLLPPLAASLAGYVWYVDGRLVANASLMRGAHGVWAMANVVVRPEQRRRGIGTALVEAVVADARAGGARELHLQVRDDNDAAQRLYRRLHFRRLHATTWLERASVIGVPPAMQEDGDVSIRPWRVGDRGEVVRMLRRASPSLASVPSAVREAAEMPAWRWALDGWTTSERRFVAASPANRALRAAAVAQPGSTTMPHRLAIAVDPAWRSRVEAPLLVALLQALRSERDAAVVVEIDEADRGAEAALLGAGFTKKRTLERLVLRFR